MLNRSEAEKSRRLLGSENAGTDDNDVENACLSMCFHPRICLKAYTGISCRNGRLATTNPWSERTSLFMRRNQHMLCQSKLFQYLSEVDGRGGGGSLELEVQVTKDHYLSIVERNLFHCCLKFLEKCRHGVY